ncbi:MAG: hypothetical protein GY929_02930, partial [Actinomycetia bacterium]|nr:hypothetical protein [Actinomycetes bacterium]
NPPGRPWTLPRRNDIGGLSVVEERPDGWYLIEDALGDSRDLFRANYPIISYATDSGNRHLVAVVDGPDGPSTWWIQDDDLTRLEGSATSVAWNGWHTRY